MALKTEPSLQIIAATSVAVSLWKHIDAIPNAYWEKPKAVSETQHLRPQVVRLVEKMKLPKSVHELIKKYVEKVYDEMKTWMLYQTRTIYFDFPGYHLIRHFSNFVWYHDCTINYKQTARNLQNSISLAETDKFRLLCLYCLKDEIEQKWKLLVQNDAIGSIRFDNDCPLLHYWRCYCKNRLQDVPVTEGMSIDEFMFRHNQVDNWPAKEYFFDRMNVDEQIQSAMWMVDRREDHHYQKFVIMKLNQTQRYTLYVNRSVEILFNYTQARRYFYEVLPMWSEMAEIITEEDFVRLLKGLFLRNLDNSIVAQIWISAPDKLKLQALNYKNDEFIQKVGSLWMNFYDDSFRMILDASTVIRREILKTKIFNDYCKMLLDKHKFSILERVLRLCFPLDEEFTSMKRKLSEIESFTKRCRDFLRDNKLAAVEQLCNFFSDVVDLNVFKEDFVNTESFRDVCSTLVNDGKISDFDKVLIFFSKPNQTKNSWRYFFGEQYLVECSEDLITHNKSSMLDEFLDCFHFTVEESMQFKRDLSSKKFFSDHCEELIIIGLYSRLKVDLDLLFPCADELIRFKEVLSKKKYVVDHCHELITRDKLTKLDELSSLLFHNVEESLKFKQNFTRKQFFDNYYHDLIKSDEFSKLEIILKSFYPKVDELIQFNQWLTRKKTFIDYCQTLVTNRNLTMLEKLLNSCLFSGVEDVAQFKQDFPKKKLFDVGMELIIDNQLSTLDDLLKLLFPSVEESTTFKKILLGKNWFSRHCETLITSGDFSVLDELLKWSFTDGLELNQFKIHLAESQFIRERCLHLYETENFIELSDLLSSLFLPRDELICEFKRNLLLLSEDGFEISLKLAEKSKNILDNFIVECLPTSISLIDFKKEIIFSPAAISHLKKEMLKKELADVKKYLNRFLTSAADRKELKMRLLDNAVELFTVYFFKLDKFTCQSRIKWWLPEKTAVEECKQKLSVDEVFEAGFKTCVFETFDPYGRVARCTFRKDFNFESLDRFLKWYFGSSKEIKEFKVRKIRTYESMETISVLLKKGCRYSYFKQLLDWFFENDAVEMAKFKKKHKGEKIANMINTVGESYSKRRRTL